ncbi:TetR/AcrR family transcriptional regulator [Sporosarcina obsidiansis]|uniref:TetR/AcrR family transcriptional regulator n=1 Tax=Sporosarcina obsidiansis TaxID=2660748 RepID=UPI00189166BA|nr:TetR/AcrR family transcriptional regulator [Sporosarcina obsidiansis]
MKREEKKQIMIDAAVHLFSKKSFSDVSIRDIAKKAEVSPALIYKYFNDQQHLYAEAMKIEAQKLLDRLSPLEQLDELVEQYILHMFNEDVLYQMMAYFMLEGAGKRPFTPPYKEVSKLIKHFEYKLQPFYPLDARKEAQLIFSTLNGLLISYKNYPTLTNEEALDHILTLSARYLSHLQTNT